MTASHQSNAEFHLHDLTAISLKQLSIIAEPVDTGRLPISLSETSLMIATASRCGTDIAMDTHFWLSIQRHENNVWQRHPLDRPALRQGTSSMPVAQSS